MNTCDNCANKDSRYCEPENRDKYGFCGNFCGDLISREDLKKACSEMVRGYNNSDFIPCPSWNNAMELIDNAPAVKYPFYQEAYQTGYEEGKNERPHDYEEVIKALEISAKKAHEVIEVFKQGLDKAEEQAKQILNEIPTGDLISRSALKEEVVKLCERINANNGMTVPTLIFTRAIDNAPAVEINKPDIWWNGYNTGKVIGEHERPTVKVEEQYKDLYIQLGYEQGFDRAIDELQKIQKKIFVSEEEPKYGWISREDMDHLDENKIIHKHFMCEKCGFIHDFIDGHTSQYNFCPNCGARLEANDDK